MNRQRASLLLLVIFVLGGLIVQAANLVGEENRTFATGAGDHRMRRTAAQGQAALSPPTMPGAAPTEGVADLNPINRSGVHALIHVQKIGQTETITGFATGLDPYKAYISFFYDAGAPGSGPCACIPSNPAPTALQESCKSTAAPPVNFSQMTIGYWLPLIGSSSRTLHVLKAGAADAPAPQAFIPLDHIGAVSLREDTQLGQALPASLDPNRFSLRACGKFRVEGN